MSYTKINRLEKLWNFLIHLHKYSKIGVIMQICNTCKIEKPLTEFNFKNKKQKKYNTKCIKCTREYGREHYSKNKEKIIKKNNKASKIRREFNKKWKSYLKCSICGEKSQSCIEFHHVDPTKKINIVSKIMNNATITAVIKEAKKCVVLCANCHRKIHVNELMITSKHKTLSNKMIDVAYNIICKK